MRLWFVSTSKKKIIKNKNKGFLFVKKCPSLMFAVSCDRKKGQYVKYAAN